MIAILIAGGVGLAFTLFMTPLFIRLFHKLEWGQFIREDGPQAHHSKRGTATMGGIVFIVGSVIAYFLATLATGDQVTAAGLLILGMMVGLGVIGFIDDFLKVRKQQSLGLGGWSKIVGQVVVAGLFAVVGLQYRNADGVPVLSTHISFIRDLPIDFMALGAIAGTIALIIWIVVITTATSNAVNVTDGLDGLATGASIISIGSYGIIAYWQFNQACGTERLAESLESACYTAYAPLDVAIVAAGIAGALIGFLWWNAPKAKVFMGDVGSMAIGGVIVAMSILSRTEILALIIAGIFVIAPGSVVLQRYYFKLTGGKRLFLMSPFHHHLEMRGWPEITIVVRMWIIAGMLAVMGVGLFYVEWLAAV